MSQLPPLFPKPHREADLGHNEDELMLKDVMTALGSINSRLAAHDARLDEIASHEVLPLAADDGMEEAVHHNIANHQKGTRLVYTAQVDEQEVTSPQPKKHQKAISSWLRTADNTVVKQITWPHELIYTQASIPALYEDLLAMSFVNGYLEVLATVKDDTKQLMLSHLQELMADREAYGWPVVLVYHAAWLQHLKQGRAAWADQDTKLKLRWVLVWHSMAKNPRPHATTAQPCKQPVNTRNQWQPGPFSEVAQPGAKMCEAFNKGQCVDSTVHPAELHVCRYCLHMVNRLCHHTKLFYKKTVYTKRCGWVV